MQERSEATCHMAMPQCCYLAKGAKRPSHTTNTIKKIRPHSIRSLQFDQKIRPLSFRTEKFDLFTATQKVACARLKKIEGEPEIETHSDDDDFASMILNKPGTAQVGAISKAQK